MPKKYNLLVPVAGRGQRMVDKGYIQPKPLIMVGDRHIIDYSLGSIDYSECQITFIVRRDHISNFAIDQVLRRKFGLDIQIVVAEQETAGSVSSCLLARDFIDNDLPLIVFCPDIYFEPKFIPSPEIFESDGFILTFKANSPNYSYVQEENGLVTRTEEKMVISDQASTGVYAWKTGKLFLEVADQAIAENIRTKNEFFVCPLYNLLIQRGGKVRSQDVPLMYITGTPEEMSFFKKVLFPFFLDRVFILAADHSGFAMKEYVVQKLQKLGWKYIDCGAYTSKDSDLQDFVSQAQELRQFYPGALILSFCRSGQGVHMAMAQNPENRAVLITSASQARLAIQHNMANCFALSTDSILPTEMDCILDVLRTEKPLGGRFQNRAMKMFKY